MTDQSSFGQAFILVFHDGTQDFDDHGKGPFRPQYAVTHAGAEFVL